MRGGETPAAIHSRAVPIRPVGFSGALEQLPVELGDGLRMHCPAHGTASQGIDFVPDMFHVLPDEDGAA